MFNEQQRKEKIKALKISLAELDLIDHFIEKRKSILESDLKALEKGQEATGTERATLRQIRYILHLADVLGQRYDKKEINSLSKEQASRMIEDLKSKIKDREVM